MKNPRKHEFSLRFLFILLLLGINLIGCARVADVVPPYIVSVSPAGLATSVALNTVIQATFSEAMDPSTIDSSPMTVASPEGAVTGTVSYESAGRTAVFAPDSSLAYYTTYTATISANVKDAAGNPMGAPYQWSFLTAAIATPGGLYATGTTMQVTLTWEAVTNASSYNLYWSNAPGVTKTTGTRIPAVSSPYTHSGLVNGRTYYYVICAVDLAGRESADSGQAAATPEALGILDTSFNGTGIVFHNGAGGSNGDERANSIAIDSSGRILVAGRGRNTAGNYDMVIWRYDPGGTLDPSLGGDGIVTDNGAAGGTGEDSGMAMALDASGRILVAGRSTNAAGNWDMVVWRYNADGTLDSSFDGDGIAVSQDVGGKVGGYDDAWAITTDSSDRILVAGFSENTSNNKDAVIWRFNADGSPDPSWDGDGVLLANNLAGGNGDEFWDSIKVDAAGRILVAGASFNGADKDMVAGRVNANATPDTAFAGTSLVINGNAAGGNGEDAANAITTDASGRILICGYSLNADGNFDLVIWRYNANGTLDTGFDGDGKAIYNNAAGGNGDDRGYSLISDLAGKILVAGSSTRALFDEDMVIWRYNPDGTLDAGFGNNGVVVHHGAALGNSTDVAHALICDSYGRILVTGSSLNAIANDDMVIWRYK